MLYHVTHRCCSEGENTCATSQDQAGKENALQLWVKILAEPEESVDETVAMKTSSEERSPSIS